MKTIKRKLLPLYALAGFGPNILNTILTIYLIDALQVTGFGQNISSWTFAGKTIVAVGIFSVLNFIAKLVDGIIDVPFAAFTDTLKTKFGRRRPAIFIGMIPMMVSFFLFCFPPSLKENSVGNAIYFGILLLVFYSFYTMTMVTYYGTYSEVCENEKDRFYLSNWKAFIDTVQYALAYALIPVFVGTGINIKMIALLCSPLFLTMALVFILVRENSTVPGDPKKYNVNENVKDEEVPFMESIRLTFKNKTFLSWLLLLSIFFFGLQMFLSGQNVLASGPMGLNGWQIAVINSAAFGPVPLTLWLYRTIMKKKGFRFAFQTALIAFMLAMITFSVSYVNWIPSQTMRLIIGAAGGTIGSYGIGAFLSAPYLVPAQMAAEEKEKTGKSHPSMYFAIQGLFTAAFGAFSTGLIWPNLRRLVVNGNELFGTHMMPYVVSITCIIACVVAIFLPKSYDELGKKKD